MVIVMWQKVSYLLGLVEMWLWGLQVATTLDGGRTLNDVATKLVWFNAPIGITLLLGGNIYIYIFSSISKPDRTQIETIAILEFQSYCQNWNRSKPKKNPKHFDSGWLDFFDSSTNWINCRYMLYFCFTEYISFHCRDSSVSSTHDFQLKG